MGGGPKSQKDKVAKPKRNDKRKQEVTSPTVNSGNSISPDTKRQATDKTPSLPPPMSVGPLISKPALSTGVTGSQGPSLPTMTEVATGGAGSQGPSLSTGSQPAAGDDEFSRNLSHSFGLPYIVNQLSTIMTDVVSKEFLAVKSLMEGQARQITKLEDEFAKEQLDNEVIRTGLTEGISKLHDDNVALRTELEELKQYSRRNSLRISNPNWPERMNEDTDQLVLDLAWQMGVDLAMWEIDRSHRVGNYSAGKPRPILVKFIGYRPRQRLFEARGRLRQHNHLRTVYINEDLTKQTNHVAYKARCYRKDKKVFATTTRDGKVYAKRFQGDPYAVIKTVADLDQISSRGNFNDVVSGANTSTPQTEGINSRLQNLANGPPHVSTPRRPELRPGAASFTPAPNSSGLAIGTNPNDTEDTVIIFNNDQPV